MTTDEFEKNIESNPISIRPLDFVSPVGHPECLGIITEVSANTYNKGWLYSASIHWIGGERKGCSYSAWWHEKDLVVIDSLPRFFAKAMSHPFGSGRKYINKAFPKSEGYKEETDGTNNL